jgi:hypothetical protein
MLWRLRQVTCILIWCLEFSLHRHIRMIKHYQPMLHRLGERKETERQSTRGGRAETETEGRAWRTRQHDSVESAINHKLSKA